MTGAKSRWLATALVAMALPVSDGDPLAQQREQFTLKDSEVAIFNLAGKVELVAGSRPEVVVGVTRGGRDGDRLKVEQGSKAGIQTLRVIYPGRQVVYPGIGTRSRTEVHVAPDGTFGGDWKTMFGMNRGVTIRGSGSGTHAWADLRIAVPRGQKIRVHHAAGEVTLENVDGDLMVDHHTGTLASRNTRGSLYLDTGSGRVTVDDAEGEVRIDTGSGGVEVSAVKGPLLHIDTGSGAVEVSGAEVERLVVDTGSGGVRLENIKAGSLNVDTGSGSVDVDLASDVESLVADTGSGSVTVSAPATLGADFDIQTGSGRIDVDFPHQSLWVERDHVTGRIGDGRGRIRIDTGSGGVKFYRRMTTSERPASMLIGLMSGPRVG
jgi:hypothetical protein